MENNKIHKLIDFCLNYGVKIIAIIVGIIGILSIFITAFFDTTFYHANEKTSFKYSFGIIEIIMFVVVFLLIVFLVKKVLRKVPSKILLTVLFLCVFPLFLLWVNTLKLVPEADQKMIHEMALSFLEGGIGYYLQTSFYLDLYPYQFGLTFFVSLIYKIFGSNYMYILFINCACSIINMLIIYYISKILFKSENIQKILVILLSVFSIYWMFFNAHFYGNIIGLTFALLAVLFALLYLEKNKFYHLFFSGTFISIAILLKTNYQIFLCGIILVLILDIIKKWKLKPLLLFPIFLIGYFIIDLGYSGILKYNDVNLSEGIPMIAFVYMGMDEPTTMSPGWYNAVTVKLYENNHFDQDKVTENSLKLIKERTEYFIQNPNELINYYSQKIGSTWLNPTFQTIWCSLPGVRYMFNQDYAHYISYHPKVLSMVGGNLYKFEEFAFNIYQIIVFIFASIGVFKISKDIDLKKAFLLIIFAGGFVFHIIWETKAIYVIQYYFLLLPFAAVGLDFIIEKFTIILNKKIFDKEKNEEP